jgi:hypothetical protein
MAGFIFSNASYISAFNFNADDYALLKATSKGLGVKYASDENKDEFTESLGKIKHCVGVFINMQGKSDEEAKSILEKVKEDKKQCVVFNTTLSESDCGPSSIIHSGAPDENLIKDSLNKCLEYLKPRGLGDLTEFCVNYITPFVFPELSAKFIGCSKEEGSGNEFNYLVDCQTSASDCVGKCTLKVNLGKLKESDPSLKDLDSDKVLDGLRELINQFLGIINHNLIKVQLKPRIGLPAVYDLSNTDVKTGSLYIPTVSFKDEKNIFHLSMGFVNLSGGEIFHLDSIDLDAPSDDVDFF